MIPADPALTKSLKINIPEELPEECLDPITKEPLKSPRLSSCGHVYSKKTNVNLVKAISKTEFILSCHVCSKEFSTKSRRFDYLINNITADIKNIGKLLEDPVSLEPIKEPFTTSCGHTFDKKTILKAFKAGQGKKCPVCNHATDLRTSVKNLNLASLINKVFTNDSK